MAMLDRGRGARRFALPGGMTVGEGWVNDPQQAYGFSKAGITPEDTGEYEGMHGEGVAGSRPGLSPAMSGLRSLVGGGGGGSDEAPGASLMRRLTSSPAAAAAHGLIDDPNTVAARNAALQRGYASPRTGVQQELDTEDLMTRRGLAMQGLRENLVGREQNVADVESERGAMRHRLPEMAHLRQEDTDNLLTRLRTQYSDPEALRAEAAGYTAESNLAGRRATAGATQKDASLKALTALLGEMTKGQGAGSGAFKDEDLQDLRDLILASSMGRGGGR